MRGVGEPAPEEEFEYREETLADDYLGQALDELMACGDARRLGLTTQRRYRRDEVTPQDKMVEVAAKRVAARPRAR